MIDLRFHPNSDKNRLGYYTVGSYHTYSKVDAIEVSLATGGIVQWHFNDQVFDNYDWKIEPTATLWALYTQRAVQIREKYDYLVLMYSGGADSHNILNAFVRNNIHLDEIVQFTNLEASGDRDNFWNAEIFRVAAPITKNLIDQNKLHTKHRLIDVSSDLINLDKIYPDLSEWIYGRSNHLSINARAFNNIRHSNRDYQELAHRGRRVCFIWGAEKPGFVNMVSPTHPGKFFPAIVFRDMLDHVFNPRDQIDNNYWINDELFYWSPESVDMLAKQAHIMHRFFTTADQQHPWLSKKSEKFGAIMHNDAQYYITIDGVNQLIYPYWDPTTFSVGKPSSQIIGERDKWMLRHDSQMRKFIFSTIREIQQRVKHYWTDWKNGMSVFYSPCYTLTSTPMDAYPVSMNNIAIPWNQIRAAGVL